MVTAEVSLDQIQHDTGQGCMHVLGKRLRDSEPRQLEALDEPQLRGIGRVVG